ncbi:MAG: Rieske 2Fe-2S domain-containing protein [Acidimicrobiaceae bacterium]|nr:Rieske 2Fe-2S domain-containing protein [Acidimicrobiaceae bacterium]
MTRYDIGVLDDFTTGTARQLKVAGRILVAVRIEQDVYILDDRCSHEDFSLAEGEVNVGTREIECARHGAMFRLSDGEPTSFPATRPVAHYVVFEDAGRLEVEVP